MHTERPRPVVVAGVLRSLKYAWEQILRTEKPEAAFSGPLVLLGEASHG